MSIPVLLRLAVIASCVPAVWASEAAPSVPSDKKDPYNQYLVSRAKDTHVFLDRGFVFSGSESAQQPKPTVAAPVYVLTTTPEGLIANRVIVMAQCSIPYGVAVSAQDVLGQNGKAVRIEESSTKYDAAPVWRVAKSSHFGKVWTVLCENAWSDKQRWGELSPGQLIERVARRTGGQRVVEIVNPTISHDMTHQNTMGMSSILPER